APTNATGYQFDFKFYSFEFPYYVCSPYNDQFIALVNPAPAGSIKGNISFDKKKNPVSVNMAFFDDCNTGTQNDFAGECVLFMEPSCPMVPNPYCPGGAAELQGTGFDTWGGAQNWGGATSWLTSQAPVHGGDEFGIRFAIW